MKYFSIALVLISTFVFTSCKSIEYGKPDPILQEQIRQEWKYGFHNMLNVKDAVPNKETAVEITKAILIPFYNEEILDHGSYNCDLVEDSVWYVSLTFEDTISEKESVVYVTIQKKDGKVLLISEAMN